MRIRNLPAFRPLLLALLLQGLAGPARAHPDQNLAEVRLAVAEWAAGVQGDDAEAVAPLLDESFTTGDESLAPKLADRAFYLATLGKFPITRVVWRYAQYDVGRLEASVSPVVIYPTRQIKNPFALTVRLARREDGWKIVALAPAKEVPRELLFDNHPLQHVTYGVPVTVRDRESGQPLVSRVHIRDADGDYWPPQFHMKVIPRGWREDIGGDVIVDGKTYAYVQGDFVAPMPAGSYVMEVERGLEYEPYRTEFSVKEGEVPRIGVELARWTHMSRKGWYSGDSHVHFLDPQTAQLEAQGEDLNVINILASSGGDLITSVNHFTGAPSVHSTPENIVYIAEETRHDYLGHTTLLNLKKLIYPMGWGEPTTGVPGGYDYPTMAHQADQAHANGALVAWAHFPEPYGEIPIDFALHKIDAAEVAVFGNPMDETPNPSSMLAWYQLLNTGSKVPGLGATDKMWNTQIVGGVRTYVKVEGTFSYQSWIDGILAGRTFVSSGPMLEFSVDGKEAGATLALQGPRKLPFHAVVDSRLPVDKVEVLVSGKVVATRDNPAGAARVEFAGELTIEDSAWVAARAYSAKVLPIQSEYRAPGAPVLAHTSPVYVDVNGRPRRSAKDAQALAQWCERTMEWARTTARYPSEARRQEVLALYARARDIYERQARGD